jgi:hypothetical protein
VPVDRDQADVALDAWMRFGKGRQLVERWGRCEGRDRDGAVLEPDAPLLYVAAGRLEERVAEAVVRSGRPGIALDLEDLFAV